MEGITINTFFENFDFFTMLIAEHILISFIAIFIAIILGMVLGIYISERPKFSFWILSVVNIMYTVPAIALLGFLISFTGIGNTTAIIALTVYALLPMVRSTYTGITNIDPLIIEAGKGMGSTDGQLLFKIKLPLAVPVLMSGIRNTVTMTIALTGIASFVGAGGLGVAIYRGITTNNPSMTFMGSFLIAILAVISDFIFSVIEKNILNRNKKKRKIALISSCAMVLGIILLGVFTSYKKSEDTIKIATKPTTENYILGEMIGLLIENKTDININISHGIGGGTANIHTAMVNGEFDIYPEYTGTIWQIVLKKGENYTEDKFNLLEEEYKNKFGFIWANLFGFNDTYAIAVRKEIAEKHNLKTISDLQRVSRDLVFGAEYDFYEREDGFNALMDKYKLKFSSEIDMDNGLKYQAIRDKKIDVMTVFTTDGQLSTSDIVVLEDDKNLYPSYLAGTVIRQEVLEKYPQLKEVLAELNDILDDKKMAELNNRVESGGESPKKVAESFLKSIGKLEGK